MKCTPRELGKMLNPIIRAEMASIGAIDSALTREDDPGYYMLFLAAKSGKQANIGQMTSMLRIEGVSPVTSGGLTETVLKLQTIAAEWIGTRPTLLAMRAVEGEIVQLYEAVFDELDGIYKKGLEKCWRRAKKHAVVLTKHLEKETRVCMRCLLDRPGDLAPLERTDPEPYQYICSGCHQEVFAAFPPDIAEKAPAWEPRALENRVIEKALGRPSKLAAENIVLAKEAGVGEDMPDPPMPYKSAIDVAARSSASQPEAEVRIAPCTSPGERLYTELLFDYFSVRENW